MRRAIGLFLIFFVTNIFADIDPIQTFYKTPSDSIFVQHLYGNTIAHIQDENFPIHVAFLQHILMKHPNFTQKVQLERLPENSRLALVVALESVGSKDPLLHKLKTPMIEKKIDLAKKTQNFKIIAPENWDGFQAENPLDMDLLWISFFATGDTHYLRKIVHATKRDDLAFEYGLELYRRQTLSETGKDLKIDLGIKPLMLEAMKISQERPGFFQLVQLSIVGVFSIRANINQDPTIKTLIHKILQEEPTYRPILSDDQEWFKNRFQITRKSEG